MSLIHFACIACMVAEIKRKLQKALVLMGEIGGNDYNFAFFQGKTLEEVYQLVPQVVKTIKDAVQVKSKSIFA